MPGHHPKRPKIDTGVDNSDDELIIDQHRPQIQVDLTNDEEDVSSSSDKTEGHSDVSDGLDAVYDDNMEEEDLNKVIIQELSLDEQIAM